MKIRIVTMMLCAWLAVNVAVAKPQKQKAQVDIYEMSLDENLEFPEVPNKESKEIASYQYAKAVELKKSGLETEVMRDNEIVVVTIPAGQLFGPNETELSDLGKLTLGKFKQFVSVPGMYKMLLVMHTDNTGSPTYTFNVTKDRVNAVYDWLDSEKFNMDYVVPYALGDSEPLLDNNSVDNRRMNRRLEIYIVPELEMINMAKKGRLK